MLIQFLARDAIRPGTPSFLVGFNFLNDLRFSCDNVLTIVFADIAHTAGYGFVKVQDPEKFNLTGGLPYNSTENTEIYVMSMFHQLHCLVS